jgi:hypothetical protein
MEIKPRPLGAHRFAELDALIAAGWGDTPGRNIPPNWRQHLKTPRAKTNLRKRQRKNQHARQWKARWKWGRPGSVNGRQA